MIEVIVSLVIGVAVGVVLTLLLTKRKSDDMSNLQNAFKALSGEALRSNNEEFIRLATQNMELLLEKTKSEFGRQAISDTIKPLKDRLEQYDSEIKRIEQLRNQQYGGLDTQLKSLIESTNKLDRETLALVNTLKRPEARGHLGELTLRRVVEMAGITEHISFVEQPTAPGESRQRPDMIIELPNRGKIIIDSKVTLKPLLDAYEEDDEKRKEELIGNYRGAVKAHIRGLAAKAYWKQFENSPDFVVMFMPGESFYFEAVKQDPDLVENAIRDNIVIATPTTLLALLRTVAMGWQEHAISENAKNISEMGKELYERICVFTKSYINLGRRLEDSVKFYNTSVGSFTSRLMPSARRLKELSSPNTRDELEQPEAIDTTIRNLDENI